MREGVAGQCINAAMLAPHKSGASGGIERPRAQRVREDSGRRGRGGGMVEGQAAGHGPVRSCQPRVHRVPPRRAAQGVEAGGLEPGHRPDARGRRVTSWDPTSPGSSRAWACPGWGSACPWVEAWGSWPWASSCPGGACGRSSRPWFSAPSRCSGYSGLRVPATRLPGLSGSIHGKATAVPPLRDCREPEREGSAALPECRPTSPTVGSGGWTSDRVCSRWKKRVDCSGFW